MYWEFLIIFFVILIGSFIQGSSGFGMGIFAMGLLPFILPVKDSTLLLIPLLCLVSLSIVIKLYKYIEFRGFFVILVTAFVGRTLSFFFLTTYGEMESLKKWLGILLIGMVVYLYVNKKKKTSPMMLKPMVPIILGFIGGFIGGAFAIGGPFFVFYFLMLYKEKRSYNANLQITFFLTNLFTVVLHLVNGDYHPTLFITFIIGAMGVFLGVHLGLKLFDKVPSNCIQKFAMIIILISALNLIAF